MEPKKLLVVDDSKLIHKMFEVMLRVYPQVHAMDGREGLQRLGEQIEAILQEARRKQDNAPAFALEKAYEIAFRDHRIRRWRMGEPARLRSFGRETLLSFFQRFYVPERIVISVAGAVDPGEVRERVEALFSSLAPGSSAVTAGPR